MNHVSKPRSSLWKGLALICIIFGVLGSTLLAPTTTRAAHTVTCDGGNGDGNNGYTADSECAQYMGNGCTHSDSPSGPLDTVTCNGPITPPSGGPWDCDNGETITEANLPALAEVAEILGLTFDEDNPCAILDEEIDDLSAKKVLIRQGQLPTKGEERCGERVFTFDILGPEPILLPVATVEAGYAYCTDGLIVYGNPGNTESPPNLIAEVIGVPGLPPLVQVICDPVRVVGARWSSYEGQSKGSFVTDATSKCTINYGADLLGISIDSVFMVGFEAIAYSYDEGESPLIDVLFDLNFR